MHKALLVAACFAALSASAANATTVHFTYSGVDDDGGSEYSLGSGNFGFNKTGSVSASDLEFFDFSQTTTLPDPEFAVSGTFSYNLLNLINFSASYADGMVSSLSFTTNAVDDATGVLAPEAFRVSSLNPGAATTRFDDGDVATRGAVSLTSAISAAPEPTQWTLMLGGVGAMGLMLRRRRPTKPYAAA